MPKRGTKTNTPLSDNASDECGFDYILSLLDVRQSSGDQAKAICPAHPDEKPSLSVTRREDNSGRTRVFFNCLSGCDFGDIARKLEISRAQVFEPGELAAGAIERRHRKVARPAGRTKLREVARYTYEDENGKRLHDQVRFDPKDFRTDPKDFPREQRVPFRLPQLIEGIRAGRRVFVVEGEKDVLALEAAGEVATTCPNGAKGWLPQYARWFEGANVWLIRDRDEAGTKFVTDVAASLRGVAKSIRCFQSRTEGEHDDVSDHLGSGWTLDPTDRNPEITGLVPFDLDAAAAAAREQELATLEHDIALREEAAARVRVRQAAAQIAQSARPMTLAQLRALPRPSYLIKRLVPRASVGELFGASGSYKTFVLIDAALHVVSGAPKWAGQRVQQGSVLFIAAEGGAGIVKRIDAWLSEQGYFNPVRAAELAEIESRLLVVPEPFPILAVEALVSRLGGFRPDWVIYDTRSASTTGLEENSNSEMNQVVAAMQKLSRLLDGATVQTVHHTGHSDTAAGRARGASSFLAGIDFSWQAEGDDSDGLRSTVLVRKMKEDEKLPPFGLGLRSVQVRDERDDDGDAITSLVVTGVTEAGADPVQARKQQQSAKAEADKEDRLAKLERQFVALVTNKPGINKRACRTALDGSNADKDEAMERAEMSGTVVRRFERTSHTFWPAAEQS